MISLMYQINAIYYQKTVLYVITGLLLKIFLDIDIKRHIIIKQIHSSFYSESKNNLKVEKNPNCSKI